jgi:hypothetical protein
VRTTVCLCDHSIDAHGYLPGDDALSAYAACHAVALELAATANGSEKGLNEAYIAEAFGLHFLTDSFSSGHMRAPRRALHDNNPLTAFPCTFPG